MMKGGKETDEETDEGEKKLASRAQMKYDIDCMIVYDQSIRLVWIEQGGVWRVG